jgi:hypothetical protein
MEAPARLLPAPAPEPSGDQPQREAGKEHQHPERPEVVQQRPQAQESPVEADHAHEPASYAPQRDARAYQHRYVQGSND